jgi:hypothetical protein
MSPESFRQGIALLAEAYPHRTVSPATLSLYREMLADLTDAEWERAVKTHLRTAKFFPAIAELLEHAKPTPTVNDVGQLFARVELRALNGKGFDAIEAEFGTAVGKAILAIGGITQLRQLERSTDRAFALKGFTAALAEQHRDDLLEPLLGPAPKRLEGLVQQTAKVLAFPTSRTKPPERAS